MNSAIRSSFAHPFLEEAQQLPLVRYRCRDDQPVDAGGAEAAADLVVPGFGAALDLRVAEVDETRLPRLGVGHAGQRAAREALLARIAEDDGHDVVAAIQA